MRKRRLAMAAAILLGALTGLLLWGPILGAHVHQQEPGLWALRFDRVLACGLDYNGPPYTAQVTLWLTCGEANGWRLWPPQRWHEP